MQRLRKVTIISNIYMEDFNYDDPDEEVSIVNPLPDDFSLDVVDIHNKGETITYTVKSRESLKLPRYAANCVSERLAQRMESEKKGVLTQAHHRELLDSIRLYTIKET